MPFFHSCENSTTILTIIAKKVNIKKYIEFWKTNLKEEFEAFHSRFRFPLTFPKIRDFQVIDNTIYILTYKEKDGKSEMYIYSMEGNLIKSVFLPLADMDILLPNQYNYYTIKDGKLYKLFENIDEESWELNISTIE